MGKMKPRWILAAMLTFGAVGSSSQCSGQDKNSQGQLKSLIEKKGYKNRNEHHPEDGEHVGNGKNPGGHGLNVTQTV